MLHNLITAGGRYDNLSDRLEYYSVVLATVVPARLGYARELLPMRWHQPDCCCYQHLGYAYPGWGKRWRAWWEKARLLLPAAWHQRDCPCYICYD